MTDHRWLESAAVYGLDALDGAERAAFDAHLADCARCRAEVQSLRDVVGLLGWGAPAAGPPAGLRNRVLAEARRVRPLRARRHLAPLAAAAALVLALGAGYGWWRARGEGRTLERALEEARTALAGRDSLLEAVLAPDLATADLAATGQPPSARLFWNPARRRLVVTVFDLPPAPAGRTYQLWAIATGKPPVSLGTFNTASDGRLTTTLTVPPDVAFQVGAVTEEPAGGSPQPTQSPFLIGQLRAE